MGTGRVPAIRDLSEVRTVIVIGMPVSLPIVDTAPSVYYYELYRTVNTLLDINGYRLSLLLNAEGFPSVWIPRMVTVR